MMLQRSKIQVYLISEDPIFIRLHEVMFKQYCLQPTISMYYSFADLQTVGLSQNPDVILVDDIVQGAASFEVLSFLRFNRQIISPICFFSDDVFDIVIKSIDRGASFFYKKPFNPKLVVSDILTNLKLDVTR